MTIINYIKRIILPIVITVVYLILINDIQFQDYQTLIHFGYYIILYRYLCRLGEFNKLFSSLYEKIHYFSFLKKVLITISISMLLGYLSRFIIGDIGTIGVGFLIPVGDETMMLIWLLTLAILKPI
ncbi:MAG: hypothetical protein RR630_05945, partial [Coprobacillus sp.]